MSSVHFHPQRIYPRYARILEISSRVPRALPITMKVAGSLIQNSIPSATENFDPVVTQASDIALIGFPRTGTTFLQRGTESWLGSTCFKGHDALAIQPLARMGKQVFVTLRDPVDTCISWSIYNRDAANVQLFRSRIQTYTAWHRKVLRISKSCHFQLVRFEDFTQSLDTVLYQGSACAPKLSSRSAPEARRLKSSICEEQLSDPNSVAVSNVPHPDRDQLKEDYKSLLSKRTIQRSLRDAEIVHQKLLGLTPAPRQARFA